jgi:hypothetical protein
MNVRITGVETTSRRVDLAVNPRTLFEALRQHVYEKAGVHDIGAYERDGRIYYEEEIETSHTSWVERILIEEPTQDQLDVIATVKRLSTLV